MNTSSRTTERQVPSRQKLVALAEPVVRKYGSLSGWRAEDTRLTDAHAGGVVGWLNEEILPGPKSFTLASEISLKELFDQVYRAA